MLSLFFGLVQHLSPLQAGYRFGIVFGAIVLTGPIIGCIQHRLGARLLLTAGLTAAGVALLSFTTVGPDTGLTAVAWRLGLLGVGFGAVLTPMTATAIAAAPTELAGLAGSANTAFRQIGGALGPAVLGAILTSRAATALPAALTHTGLPRPPRWVCCTRPPAACNRLPRYPPAPTPAAS